MQQEQFREQNQGQPPPMPQPAVDRRAAVLAFQPDFSKTIEELVGDDTVLFKCVRAWNVSRLPNMERFMSKDEMKKHAKGYSTPQTAEWVRRIITENASQDPEDPADAAEMDKAVESGDEEALRVLKNRTSAKIFIGWWQANHERTADTEEQPPKAQEAAA